ncbi:MAG: dTMP kinase [Cyanobacteria bacterium J06560_6]
MLGKLIVFEGGEGCGKTTQVQRLHGWLDRSEALKLLRTQNAVSGIKLTREPGGTEVGTKIRQLLLTAQSSGEAPLLSKTELLLYAADRAQHVEETLRPWIEEGYWVLCDRFTDSTVAYQGYGRQLDFSLINTLNKIATGGLQSDLTLWINASPEVGLSRMRQRGQADRIEQAGLAFHQRVNAGFSALANPATHAKTSSGTTEQLPANSGPTVEIDGNRSIEEVSAQIQQVIQARLSQWYPQLTDLV